jgi:hypothetical protein
VIKDNNKNDSIRIMLYEKRKECGKKYKIISYEIQKASMKF